LNAEIFTPHSEVAFGENALEVASELLVQWQRCQPSGQLINVTLNEHENVKNEFAFYMILKLANFLSEKKNFPLNI